MRDYSRIIMGGSNVDEDGSKVESPSQHGARTGTYLPLIRVLMVAELGIVFGNIFWDLGFFHHDKYIVQRAS